MSLVAVLYKNRWPFLAALACSTAALAGFRSRPAVSALTEPVPRAAVSAPPAATGNWDPTIFPLSDDSDETDDGPIGASLAGQVLEQIDVDKYSYLRLGESGTEGTWVAVPVTSSRLGQRVTVTSAQLMTHFMSATLKRTFESIYFGVLETPTDSSHPLSAPITGSMQMPHPGPGPGADSVAVGQLSRAPGPLGTTVVELNTASATFSNKIVRVHAVVVKSTSGVLGRTFLHVRDGSGSAKAASNDLTVTSASEFPIGVQVLLEGKVSINADFGAGYRYPVLLNDAVLIRE